MFHCGSCVRARKVSRWPVSVEAIEPKAPVSGLRFAAKLTDYSDGLFVAPRLYAGLRGIAPSSRLEEPPANPARFTRPESRGRVTGDYFALSSASTISSFVRSLRSGPAERSEHLFAMDAHCS